MATYAQPIACSLSTADLRDRRAWIADLARDGLHSHQRDGLVLRRWYNPDAASRVREMVRREEVCCAFLTFEMHEQPDAVELRIKVPEAARDVADALFDQFLATAR